MSENEALMLTLMCVGALFIPFTSKRLMLPSSVGEIIYGMVLASLFPINDNLTLIEYFATFGFFMLMYIAGLELNFDRVRSLSKKDIWLYILMYIPIVIISYIIVLLLNIHPAFTLIFFTIGIGLLFPVLKETGLIKTDFGQNILIIGMIGEILTLIGLTLVTLVYEYGLTQETLLHFTYIGIFFLGIYFILRIMKLALWWNPSLQSVFLEVGNPAETGIRTNYAILFFFVSMAGLVHIKPIVGAFIGGMMLALVFSVREGVLDKMGGVGYGFFIPIFFISVGTKVSFSDFVQPDIVFLSLIITGVLIVTKIIGCLLLFFSTIKKSHVILVGISLSFPLTMLVAVASVYQEAGIISANESSAILLSAMLSSIIYPWLFKLVVTITIPELNHPLVNDSNKLE